jgi:hypothetical protein
MAVCRSESRNGIAESGRRSSKNVKLRAVKPAGAASLTDTACGSQSASSALYSHQVSHPLALMVSCCATMELAALQSYSIECSYSRLMRQWH